MSAKFTEASILQLRVVFSERPPYIFGVACEHRHIFAAVACTFWQRQK